MFSGRNQGASVTSGRLPPDLNTKSLKGELYVRVACCLIFVLTLAAHAQSWVCPSMTPVAVGQSVPFPLKLSSPAPAGGVFISLTSSNSSSATVTPATYIATGDLGPLSSPSVTGVAVGSTNITIAAFGWPKATCTVYVGSTGPSSSGTSNDTQPPSTPAITLTVVKGPTEVALTWSASLDNVGVAGYQILRNGQPITTVSGMTLTYSDTSVTANTTANYVVKAYDAAGNYSSASNGVSVTTPSGSNGPCTCISSCQPITQGGRYALAKNLTATPNGLACIRVDGVSGVKLDCLDHSVTVDRNTNPTNQPAIQITNASDYSVANCKLNGLNNPPTTDLIALLYVNQSPRGSITGNAIAGGFVLVTKSDNTLLSRNTSNGQLYVEGNAAVIEYNTITLESSRIYNTALALSSSSGSYIQYNNVNGGWTGGSTYGADSGIGPYNIRNTTIRNNTIQNTWNCGIESSGPLFNVRISDNRISTAQFCGVGGWYANSMQDVVVDGNIVTDSHLLFYYARADGLAAYLNETTVYCKNNVLTNNKLVNPRPNNSFPTLSGVLNFYDLTGIPAGALVAGNNRLANNDFGPYSVRLLPVGSIVDGGGNVCVTDPLWPNFPIHCQQN